MRAAHAQMLKAVKKVIPTTNFFLSTFRLFLGIKKQDLTQRDDSQLKSQLSISQPVKHGAISLEFSREEELVRAWIVLKVGSNGDLSQ